MCHIQTSKQGVCCRVNSLKTYSEMHSQLSSLKQADLAAWLPIWLHSFSDISKTFKGSRIHPEAVIEANCTIRSSSIGKGAHIHMKAKVQNSIIMENGRVGESVSLHNSIVGEMAEIGSNSVLIGCHVQHNFKMAENTQAENETFPSFVDSLLDEKDDNE
ncbi:putative eukaryotic initiation factor-2B, gamma subunit [Cardiosporidium cionae]|uniref:Eukaryotic initiation factor-2B, gamma subunit n=1 Tax=Cardiosporidium cionae TaxID=476202 RepID=A0ABQ7JA36_9APIC|nr:putative eukaryotic initiation factor-2B, gamma subunit [Cardiosporidium cionae]|eukprot:KAF8820842.1 putative eukaryotic initiation factor-2B, gamma subunit [Cardiosporidium cionae]